MEERIISILLEIKADIGGLKKDVGELKEDVSVLKEGQRRLEADVSDLKDDMFDVKTTVNALAGVKENGLVNSSIDKGRTED